MKGKTMEGIITITEHVDLVYSPDDDGWYFQDYANGQRVSVLYDSEWTARQYWSERRVTWDGDGSQSN